MGAAVESLDSLKITEVVRVAQVLNASTKKSKPARPNEMFNAPDALSTGPDSRVEMVSADGTITRVGANSLFHFAPGKREVNLEKGCVLFQSPTGKGGGVIRTPSATAAVLGTSIIVTATKNGGFKLLVLEGKAKASLPGGLTATISAGQMTFVMPGSRQFGPVLNFRLKDQVSGSGLVKGFKSQVPSMDKITNAVAAQETAIASGKAQATNLLVADTQVYEAKVVDSSLVQTRMVVEENSRKSDLNSSKEGSNRSPISLALGMPVTLNSSTQTLPASQLFSFKGANLPADLAASMGNILADYIMTGGDKNSLFGALIGSEISINSVSDSLSSYAQSALGGSVDEFLVYSPGKVTIQEGATDQDLTDQKVSLLMSSAASSPMEPPFWIMSQTQLSISNVVADTNTDFMILGRSHNANANLLIKDSVILNAGGYIDMYGGQINVSNSPIVSKLGIYMESIGDITVSNPDGKVRQITAGNPIVVTPETYTIFSAVGDISVTNAAINSALVSMSAKTVKLQNVTFVDGSQVTLRSRDGVLADNPNTNQPAVEGKVNYINGVMYGSQQAQLKTNGYNGQTGQPITIIKTGP
jgi:hypothetical protein